MACSSVPNAGLNVNANRKRRCPIMASPIVTLIRFFKDGDQWCATYIDFMDLEVSPAGFGDSPTFALANLLAESDRIRS